MKTYDESLKVLWDNYSVRETMRAAGREEEKREGLTEGPLKRQLETEETGHIPFPNHQDHRHFKRTNPKAINNATC